MTWSETDESICKEAWDYAEAVVTGEIPACEFVRNSCKASLDMRLRSDVYFDDNAAARPIRFANFLNHLKGPLAGLQLNWSRGKNLSSAKCTAGCEKVEKD